MINKYNPIISDSQKDTCQECYVNVVKDSIYIVDLLDDSVCMPLLANPQLYLYGNAVPPSWTVTNNCGSAFIPDPSDPLTPIIVANIFTQPVLLGVNYPFKYETTQILPTPCGGNYLEISQPFVLTQSTCGDYHRLKLDTDVLFTNCIGTISIEIKDSSNVIVYENVDGAGQLDICIKSTDTNFTIKYKLVIDNPDRSAFAYAGQPIKKLEVLNLQVCEVYPSHENIYTEDFSNPIQPYFKENVVSDGDNFCIGDQSTFMILQYSFILDKLKQYSLDVLLGSTYPTAQTFSITIWNDATNTIVSTGSYNISPNTTTLVQHPFTPMSSGKYRYDIVVLYGDERICINGLWLSDRYDGSNNNGDFCIGGGTLDIHCNCYTYVYGYKNLPQGESGYLQYNRLKYNFKSAQCNQYIRIKYYNDCPIITEDGDFLFHKDDSGNVIPLEIVLQGFVFGSQPKFEEGSQRNNLFNRRRTFSKAIIEQDIEVDAIPEELVKSLTLALMCKYIYIDLGDGVYKEVFTGKDTIIDSTPNNFGTVDIKFTITTGGLLNSNCNC